ncbi:MAG: sigma-70 family RNA polymerase sigma factor [Candidatus Andeanibacterium colombiense]|uniref:Sigma-70 family RNA polymerase sigma factor n=1 Tax=Candidatus Andeanibacterium colombiense TaxID=3121345 RepID=A0AAJ5X2L7_9SPHN|nr:MAG: sigma-70 family RNA polymerase sigma factor [Sphingomonadaceae bacterium]
MKLFLNASRNEESFGRARVAQNDDLTAGRLELSDTYLVAQAGAGNVEAFALLVERHTSALYRVACRMLGDRLEAEDVVQECFAKLWTSAPGWAPKGCGLVGWLHRVAMNLCLDRLRKPAPLVTDAFPDIEDLAPLQDRTIEGRQARLAIESALEALPAHYRAALVLSYYEGFPNATASEAMEMNLKAFESLLVRARQHLRKLLETNGFHLADLEVLP